MLLNTSMADRRPIIIAHRGASGYLPEHTLESKAMAYAMGPDYIEQDVAVTRDDKLVVIHDHFLDTVSNVREVFPSRKRDDGRYYVVDFSLKELKQLNIHERTDTSNGAAVYTRRFPNRSRTQFDIATLDEEIEMILGLNKSTGKNVGIYTEIKDPFFHMKEGKDISRLILKTLTKYGYVNKKSKCYIQSFDPECLVHLRKELKAKVKLVQLIADEKWIEQCGVDYNRMLTPEGMDEIKKYADAIGPWMHQVVIDRGKGVKPKITDVVNIAHERKLRVHTYTLRADDLPSYARNLNDLFRIFFIKAGVDGVFTDFPDRGVEFLRKKGLRR